MMRKALADDQRKLCQLVAQGKPTFAELTIALLSFLAFGTAGLQRPSLPRSGIVIRIDQRVNVMVHVRKRMLQPILVLPQPLLT